MTLFNIPLKNERYQTFEECFRQNEKHFFFNFHFFTFKLFQI